MAEQDYEQSKKILENEKIEKAVGITKSLSQAIYSKKKEYVKPTLVSDGKGKIIQLPFHYDLFVSTYKRPFLISIPWWIILNFNYIIKLFYVPNT